MILWRRRYYTAVTVVGVLSGVTTARWFQRQFFLNKAKFILALDLYDFWDDEDDCDC